MTQYDKDIKSGRVVKPLSNEKVEGSFAELLAYRSANKEWLRESFIIGIQILNALESKKWKQKDLALALNVSPQMVQKYLSGHCEFGLPLKHKLQKVLGIKLGEAYFLADMPIDYEDGHTDCIIRSIESINLLSNDADSDYDSVTFITLNHEKRAVSS